MPVPVGAPLAATASTPTGVPTPPAAGPRPASATPSLGRDTLKLSGSASSLRDEVATAQRITGKPVAFKNAKSLDAYLKSVELARKPAQYDREGFLTGTLGLSDVNASGRWDRPTVEAMHDVDGYKPDNKLLGMPILPQQLLFALAKSNASAFLWVAGRTNPVLEAFDKLEDKWDKPFLPVQKAQPTGETVAQRYAAMHQVSGEIPLRFNQDFHSGIPELDSPPHNYGTYSIARSLGFTDAQARRIGLADNGVDKNTTPYGRTSPSPLDQMDRHFNLNPKGEDTRLIWAGRHLKAAVGYAQQGAFDQAEIELGVGLHSLQDEFAHGQLSPSVHSVVGEFPDNVQLNPVAVTEATQATAAYLKAYLTAIAPPAQP